MTEPREVTVSDEEVIAFLKTQCVNVEDVEAEMIEDIRQALAAFIAARVPDAPLVMRRREYADGFKKCRDKVLKGV